MKQKFLGWSPSQKSAELLQQVNIILEYFEKQGYNLTLRQLYYQLVSKDIIANRVEMYNSLGNMMSKARLAGLVDWSMIEDRVRKPKERSHWQSPREILLTAISSYYISRWKDQENYIEVWCEKDAVSNIIEPVCSKYDVLFMANRGYSSQTAMYDGYKRLSRAVRQDKNVMLIYLGDHDPSGMDMDNDIRNRMGNFFFEDKDCLIDEFRRIALTMDQIEQYNPPENPAKINDRRFDSYAEKYGESSWELDALEPSVLSEIVENAILEYVDMEEFDRISMIEEDEKEEMKLFADKWREDEG